MAVVTVENAAVFWKQVAMQSRFTRAVSQAAGRLGKLEN